MSEGQRFAILAMFFVVATLQSPDHIINEKEEKKWQFKVTIWLNFVNVHKLQCMGTCERQEKYRAFFFFIIVHNNDLMQFTLF